MEVILLERVEKLGVIGDVVTVKNGFARNYLLPNKKALRANEANRKVFEANRARIEAENAEKRSEAEKAAKGVDGKTVQLIRQASNVGHLYGSVSVRDIAEALEGQGAHVTKGQVVLDRPIKAIGMHEVKVALHPEVSVTVKVNVARSPEEADLQAQGAKVTKSQIVLDRPIKAIGMHEVKVALHPEVSVTVKVNVARSPEEAELQAQGIDVMASMFEREEAGFTEQFDPNAEPGVIADEAAAETPATEAAASTEGEEA